MPWLVVELLIAFGRPRSALRDPHLKPQIQHVFLSCCNQLMAGGKSLNDLQKISVRNHKSLIEFGLARKPE